MKTATGIRIVAGTFFRNAIRSRRTKAFLVISFIPPFVMALLRVIAWSGGRSGAGPALFTGPALAFYFQLLIPVLALFYGSTTVSDEIEDRTLAYLITRPVPRGAVFLGKSLAYAGVALFITALSLTASFAFSDPAGLGDPHRWGLFLGSLAVALLAVLAYCALFAWLGTWLKRPVISGLVFVFGWESVIQFMPGITQQFTLIHYIKSLLPQMERVKGPLTFQLDPTGPAASAITLLAVAAVALAAGAAIFRRREYIVSESN